jgi:hypothetical protein
MGIVVARHVVSTARPVAIPSYILHGGRYRSALAPQFLDHIVIVHELDLAELLGHVRIVVVDGHAQSRS